MCSEFSLEDSVSRFAVKIDQKWSSFFLSTHTNKASRAQDRHLGELLRQPEEGLLGVKMQLHL